MWADGKQYIGDMAADVRHGEGKFIWPDGREFEGSWVDGKQFGIGYFSDKNGVK